MFGKKNRTNKRKQAEAKNKLYAHICVSTKVKNDMINKFSPKT